VSEVKQSVVPDSPAKYPLFLWYKIVGCTEQNT